MTLRDIVTLVARKRGLEVDNTYTANLLELAKQRAKQVWESYDWMQKLRRSSITVEANVSSFTLTTLAGAPLYGLASLISLVSYDRLFDLEPADAIGWHRQNPLASNAPSGVPSRYALTTTSTEGIQLVFLDAAYPEEWIAQALYRITYEGMFEGEDVLYGAILLPGAEAVLEHHIEADSLEMDEQRAAAAQQRGMAERRLAEMKERAARSPAHQRVRPMINFTDND